MNLVIQSESILDENVAQEWALISSRLDLLLNAVTRDGTFGNEGSRAHRLLAIIAHEAVDQDCDMYDHIWWADDAADYVFTSPRIARFSEAKRWDLAQRVRITFRAHHDPAKYGDKGRELLAHLESKS